MAQVITVSDSLAEHSTSSYIHLEIDLITKESGRLQSRRGRNENTRETSIIIREREKKEKGEERKNGRERERKE